MASRSQREGVLPQKIFERFLLRAQRWGRCGWFGSRLAAALVRTWPATAYDGGYTFQTLTHST
jgi:hypothetical protein